MYAITLQTKIPADKATDGETVFKNQAQMTWGIPGTDGETPRESASGSVTSDLTGDNSGSGSGNVKGNVTLTKVSDDESESPLEGAVYDLYEVGNDVAIKTGLTTDSTGKINVSNLAPGEYYFKETTPPSGFQVNTNEIPFTITGDTTTPIELTGRDDPVGEALGSILIQKLDLETGHKLTGAEFEITQTSGDSVGKTWTTTADGNGLYHVSDLPYGTYTIQETKAPNGYILDSTIREFTISSENPNPGLLTFDNEKEVEEDSDFSATIQKFDGDELKDDNYIGVPGAVYGLYNADGSLIGSYMTDSHGVITANGLPTGSYYFQETLPPDGYDINDEKIHFTISDEDIALGLLQTSDPKLTTTEPGDNGGEDGNEEDGNEEDSNEENGNEGNGNEGNGNEGDGNEEDSNEEDSNEEDSNEEDSNEDTDGDSGLITNPLDPDNNNNNGNTDENTVNPNTPKPPYEGNGDSSQTYLPQTSTDTGVLASIIGLLTLVTFLYFRRRKA